jgi:CheY-like chemotaxis protein
LWGEQVAKVLAALVPILWALIGGYVIYLLRETLAGAFGRMTGLEVFGVKLALSGVQAMNAAIDIAQKNPQWQVEIPQADRKRALDRANKERALLEGAEILWVDDRPSNNRNETRMLRSFGALITFACSTDEAVDALQLGVQQRTPFDLIISDISRGPSDEEQTAGVAMLERLSVENLAPPVVFYIGRIRRGAGTPDGAFGLTNRPDQLLHLVLDALARERGPIAKQ